MNDRVSWLSTKRYRLPEDTSFLLNDLEEKENEVLELRNQVAALQTDNERLLAANRDVMLHWDVLKADYERLRAALERIADGPWPDAVDTPEAQCRFDEDIARAALDGQPEGDKHE